MGTVYRDVEWALLKHLRFLDEEEREETRVFVEALLHEKLTKAKDPEQQEYVKSELVRSQFLRAGELYETFPHRKRAAR